MFADLLEREPFPFSEDQDFAVLRTNQFDAEPDPGLLLVPLCRLTWRADRGLGKIERQHGVRGKGALSGDLTAPGRESLVLIAQGILHDLAKEGAELSVIRDRYPGTILKKLHHGILDIVTAVALSAQERAQPLSDPSPDPGKMAFEQSIQGFSVSPIPLLEVDRGLRFFHCFTPDRNIIFISGL
jgi:hypothetical protein